MSTRRGSMFVGVVLILALIQVGVVNTLLFVETTGTNQGGVLGSPFVLVGVPLGIFVVLAGLLFSWAILTADTLQ